MDTSMSIDESQQLKLIKSLQGSISWPAALGAMFNKYRETPLRPPQFIQRSSDGYSKCVHCKEEIEEIVCHNCNIRYCVKCFPKLHKRSDRDTEQEEGEEQEDLMEHKIFCIEGARGFLLGETSFSTELERCVKKARTELYGKLKKLEEDTATENNHAQAVAETEVKQDPTTRPSVEEQEQGSAEETTVPASSAAPNGSNTAENTPQDATEVAVPPESTDSAIPPSTSEATEPNSSAMAPDTSAPSQDVNTPVVSSTVGETKSVETTSAASTSGEGAESNQEGELPNIDDLSNDLDLSSFLSDDTTDDSMATVGADQSVPSSTAASSSSVIHSSGVPSRMETTEIMTASPTTSMYNSVASSSIFNTTTMAPTTPTSVSMSDFQSNLLNTPIDQFSVNNTAAMSQGMNLSQPNIQMTPNHTYSQTPISSPFRSTEVIDLSSESSQNQYSAYEMNSSTSNSALAVNNMQQSSQGSDAFKEGLIDQYNALNSKIEQYTNYIQKLNQHVKQLSTTSNLIAAQQENIRIHKYQEALKQLYFQRDAVVARVVVFTPSIRSRARNLAAGTNVEVPSLNEKCHKKCANIANRINYSKESIKSFEGQMEKMMNRGSSSNLFQIMAEMGKRVSTYQDAVRKLEEERDNTFLLLVQCSQKVREIVRKEAEQWQGRSLQYQQQQQQHNRY